ncbi:hypothetical protein [Saccharothrix deserti]|nr:hypothetical protein [Saccharothrix deserti]
MTSVCSLTFPVFAWTARSVTTPVTRSPALPIHVSASTPGSAGVAAVRQE